MTRVDIPQDDDDSGSDALGRIGYFAPARIETHMLPNAVGLLVWPAQGGDLAPISLWLPPDIMLAVADALRADALALIEKGRASHDQDDALQA